MVLMKHTDYNIRHSVQSSSTSRTSWRALAWTPYWVVGDGASTASTTTHGENESSNPIALAGKCRVRGAGRLRRLPRDAAASTGGASCVFEPRPPNGRGSEGGEV
jgi:hypothetical protein